MRARVRFSRSSVCSLKMREHGLDDGVGLVLRDERGDAHAEVRLGGEAAADAQGVADLFPAVDSRLIAVSADVVDLRVGAPQRAAGDGDFELARQVVELRIGGEPVGDLEAPSGLASIISWPSARPAGSR